MKKLLSTVLAGAIVASTASLAMAASDGTSKAKMTDLNTIYYLKDDFNTLKSQDSFVKFNATPQQEFGFENIDAVVTGKVSDKYTLVFGATGNDFRTSGNEKYTTAAKTLAGDVKSGGKVDFIPILNYKLTTLNESSSDSSNITSNKSVEVSFNKTGTKISEGQAYSTVAGMKIVFNKIGNKDLYTIKHLTLTGKDGLPKSFKILFKNERVEAGDTSIVDGATSNDDTGYKELNGSSDLFRNGKVLTAATVKAMRDNGEKYAMFMSNGVNILVDKISKATVDAGAVTLSTDVNVDATLRDRYAEAAGGSIVTFKVNSGFTKDNVQYQIDLNEGDATKTMSSGEQNKWTDGKKVFCYIVNRANLDTLANGSAADGIVNSEKMLPCTIKDEKLVVTVNPTKFDAEKEMLMFTLKELDIAKLPAVSGVSVDSASNAEVVAPVVSEVVSAPVADQVKDTAVISEPAATGRAVTQTGATDVVALAIVLAAISMGAAGTVAFRKAR